MNEPRVKARMSLIGLDGNAFSVIGAVSVGLRRAGATPEEVDAFQAEATSGGYDKVLQTAMKWTTDEDSAELYDEWSEKE